MDVKQHKQLLAPRKFTRNFPRFSIGFWHADFDEAAPARLWLAQNGAQASGNTDEAKGKGCRPVSQKYCVEIS